MMEVKDGKLCGTADFQVGEESSSGSGWWAPILEGEALEPPLTGLPGTLISDRP